MSLIEWKEEFELGVPAIDHEHRELITLINQLFEEAEFSGDRDRLVESLGEIYAQIAAHFALEEKMMRNTGYEALGEHKDDHEKLLDQLRDIMDRVEDEPGYDKNQLSGELEHWFTEHFRTHDAKLHRPNYT